MKSAVGCVAVVAVLFFVLWQLLGEPAKERKARRAMGAAIDACIKARIKPTDPLVLGAESAIRKTDPAKWQVYDDALHSQLKEWGCY